jgi:hypothetical protein
MPRSTLSFGADTSELDAAFGRLDDQLANFAANVAAISATIAASSGNAREQDAGDDAAYWQNLIEQARAASGARNALDQAGLASHRATARQWQAVDGEIGRDFSNVVMAAITDRKGGIGAALASVVRRGLGDALSGIGKGLAGQLQSALGLGDISPAGLIGSLFGGSGASAGTAAMTELNTTLASTSLVTEGLDVTTAANTLATTANTAAEGAGGAGGALGLAGLLGFAGGGRPATGIPSLVGERGPELFLPDVAGTVIPNGGWELRAPALPAAGATGDFAPSISMPVAFHGGTGAMSKAEFRRMLGDHMDYLVGELRNLHRNGGRRGFLP